MDRSVKPKHGAPPATTRQRFRAVTRHSPRTLLLGTVLLVTALSAATSYLLTQLFAVDVVSSLLNTPQDCWLDWQMNIGRHCFSDYSMVVGAGVQSNPWVYEMRLPFGDYAPLRIGGPAAAILPHMLFGFPAYLLGMPRLGLVGYLVALTVAVLTPAIWAARGTRGLERVVVFIALGAAAVPVWAVIDRGNSAGFIVPIALVYLIALRRQRWLLVAVMVVLATLVKPWFGVLVVALFVARQWRAGGLALLGVAISQIVAYLLWPKDFPGTITQSIHNLSDIGGSFADLISLRNVSFGRGLLLIPDTLSFLQTGGQIPDGFLAAPRNGFGYLVVAVFVVVLLALGRRIPPVMAGIVLLATATLFPPLAYYYYLALVLPIAALVVRDPESPTGSGIFDRFSRDGIPRPAVGFWVSLASAFSIAQIAIPAIVVNAPIFGQFGERGVVDHTPVEFVTTVIFTPFLWFIACLAIIVSYARTPADSVVTVESQPAEEAETLPVGSSPGTSESVNPPPSPRGEP